ncbi:MAG: methylenetetrahydrofolate reductase [NAD(P)H] [Bacteroidia bacterium]|jgi:methylenetetrahydrofolate reductase (NADPH)|tara:strand:+ start:1296 stop:2246 length:951 start_codon:yes stop_codon:yes gene_type:complete
MKLTEYFKSDKTIFSFEVLPPLKGKSIDSLYNAIDPLMEFNPAFVDVTYHREEYIERPRKDGGYDKISTKKRPGTVAICAAIMNKYKVEAVPHLICGGFSKDETENALIDLAFLGIENVLALRGDNLKNERNFVPEKDGNGNSLDLIRQIGDMNSGVYLDRELQNATETNFCIGAAGYPEKHVDAANMQSDLKFLKRKVDAGAEFITTQMFFDNKKYFEYVDLCREAGIHVPIIPGIKPITKKIHLRALPSIFNMDIPEPLASELHDAKDDAAARQIGIEWCIQQCKELKASNVPALHFYTMSFSSATKDVVSQVF